MIGRATAAAAAVRPSFLMSSRRPTVGTPTTPVSISPLLTSSSMASSTTSGFGSRPVTSATSGTMAAIVVSPSQ